MGATGVKTTIARMRSGRIIVLTSFLCLFAIVDNIVFGLRFTPDNINPAENGYQDIAHDLFLAMKVDVESPVIY